MWNKYVVHVQMTMYIPQESHKQIPSILNSRLKLETVAKVSRIHDEIAKACNQIPPILHA